VRHRETTGSVHARAEFGKITVVDPEERKLNVRWAVVILLLLAGIDGLLTRLLEGLWDSLRQRNSPAYLPLEWWMSVPFTVFVFMVLSALLTSFSSWKRWLRAFLSLCGFKVVFAGVTAFVLYYRTDIGAGEAFSQAMFLSLPSVLVHILFAALALMFLMDAFARRGAEEKLPSIYLPGAELEEPLVPPEAPAPAADISPAREAASGVALALPVRKLLGLFPRGELAIPPQQIEELSVREGWKSKH
jgi:hypothetical protein